MLKPSQSKQPNIAPKPSKDRAFPAPSRLPAPLPTPCPHQGAGCPHTPLGREHGAARSPHICSTESWGLGWGWGRSRAAPAARCAAAPVSCQSPITAGFPPCSAHPSFFRQLRFLLLPSEAVAIENTSAGAHRHKLPLWEQAQQAPRSSRRGTHCLGGLVGSASRRDCSCLPGIDPTAVWHPGPPASSTATGTHLPGRLRGSSSPCCTHARGGTSALLRSHTGSRLRTATQKSEVNVPQPSSIPKRSLLKSSRCLQLCTGQTSPRWLEVSSGAPGYGAHTQKQHRCPAGSWCIEAAAPKIQSEARDKVLTLNDLGRDTVPQAGPWLRQADEEHQQHPSVPFPHTTAASHAPS